jgi:hypothetical protein
VDISDDIIDYILVERFLLFFPTIRLLMSRSAVQCELKEACSWVLKQTEKNSRSSALFTSTALSVFW